jgi:uncharacterized membrane-anchored protein
MLNKSLFKNILYYGISLLINTIVGGFIFYIFCNFIIARFASLTAIQRQGYQNDFLNCIGTSFGFLLMIYVGYLMIILIFGKGLSDNKKSVVAMIVAAGVVIGLNAITFGFSFTYYGHLLELILMVFLAANIPFLVNYFMKKLK